MNLHEVLNNLVIHVYKYITHMIKHINDCSNEYCFNHWPYFWLSLENLIEHRRGVLFLA